MAPKYLLSIMLGVTAAHAAVEEPIDHRFVAAIPDPIVGDWQGTAGAVAQATAVAAGSYQVLVLRAFDEPNARPLAVLHGPPAQLAGDGWSGTIATGVLRLAHGPETYVLRHVTRPSPTLGEKPPADAIVLFDGRNLDAWANKKGKDWLTEGGPAPWKIVDGLLEVVPGTGSGIISHRQFGDCQVHVEFRTLGAPSNSGVFLETRYEANINETYGRLDGTPNGGFDNCTPKGSEPRSRATRPPLEWQTFDIDFTAPRFDAAGKKTSDATATLRLNGVTLYDHQKLELPHGAAGRLGEAPKGPIMLQEHGMPLQFRNIWVKER